MGISDTVLANLTSLYLVAIVGIKAYGVISGRNFSGGFVLMVSTIVVGGVLAGTLTWDVSRKATHALCRDPTIERCRGGICWHGVAVRSPMSQVRFHLDHQTLSAPL
ncbi:uncharacterized protein LOC122085107 [Macadamia integrifolia]|uniref:uncharacterized protein LOC122085107 n=1 Tax=Macadamia integrifolia TaxID=60698 RepID=UPI001C4FD589|nr:uncharacterized protein LOC122085107 [Macadamia integrifolia]